LPLVSGFAVARGASPGATPGPPKGRWLAACCGRAGRARHA